MNARMMDRRRDRPRRGAHAALVAILLGLQAALLAWGAWRHSPTWTEVCHLPAGLSHWQLGSFELYQVNPPLIRMVATLPLLVAGPSVDWHMYYDDPHQQAVWQFGREFMANNGYRAFWLTTLARWSCIPFSLLGGWLCHRWASELHGAGAGLLALTLWCFDPNILAHGQLIATDAQGAVLGLAVFYLFWRWLRRPSWAGALLVGAVLGLAELTRTTWIILFPLLPCVWLVRRIGDRSHTTRASALQVVVMLSLGVYVLNLGYGFEGSCQRLGDFQFISKGLAGHPEEDAYQRLGNRFAGTWLGAIRVPLPRNYILGFDRQKWDFERERWSYLRGEWRNRGWWYYYVYALGIKEPLGTWLLIILAVATLIHPDGGGRRDTWYLLLPVVVVLTLVSSQIGLNKHLRYALPVLPFLFIFASRTARLSTGARRGGRAMCGIAPPSPHSLAGLTAVCVTWSVLSSLWIYPHSLSYFNELVGGPRRGHRHLIFSNISWGQDLLYLRRWYDAHPEARPLAVAYDLSLVDPKFAGIEHHRPPKGPNANAAREEARELGPQPGWYAMNINRILNNAERYQYFLRFEPVERVCYSTYIYHISLPDANRVRRQLGLPQLAGPAFTSAGPP